MTNTVVQDAANELFGYKVEQVADDDPRFIDLKVFRPAYLLIGPRVTYKLIRNLPKPDYMFAVNSHNNICGIKGNYDFTDKPDPNTGIRRLRPVYR